MQEVIEKLRKIAAGDLTDVETPCGLCFHLGMPTTTKLLELLEESLETWPHYSGDIAYPIPSLHEDFTPRDVYWSDIPKWEGEYLRLRMDLARHFADFLEAESCSKNS